MLQGVLDAQEEYLHFQFLGTHHLISYCVVTKSTCHEWIYCAGCYQFSEKFTNKYAVIFAIIYHLLLFLFGAKHHLSSFAVIMQHCARDLEIVKVLVFFAYRIQFRGIPTAFLRIRRTRKNFWKHRVAKRRHFFHSKLASQWQNVHKKSPWCSNTISLTSCELCSSGCRGVETDGTAA